MPWCALVYHVSSDRSTDRHINKQINKKSSKSFISLEALKKAKAPSSAWQVPCLKM